MKDKNRLLLILGLIGILATILTIVSDIILLGMPNSAYNYFKLGTETMATIPQFRITLGTFIGVIMIPFQIAGIISIYYGLKPSGKIPSLLLVIIMIHASIMGTAFHISYGYMGTMWRFCFNNTKSVPMINQFNYYWKLLLIIMAIELAIASLIYVFQILKRKTLYPKWMILFNPICIVFYMYFIILPIPYPIGGFLASCFLNLATLVFFILNIFSPKKLTHSS